MAIGQGCSDSGAKLGMTTGQSRWIPTIIAFCCLDGLNSNAIGKNLKKPLGRLMEVRVASKNLYLSCAQLPDYDLRFTSNRSLYQGQ